MNDSGIENEEISTSMENPDLDDRPSILRLANIDPAKRAKKLSVKYQKDSDSFKYSWWQVMTSSINPWYLITFVMVLIAGYYAIEVYKWSILNSDSGITCIQSAIPEDSHRVPPHC